MLLICRISSWPISQGARRYGITAASLSLDATLRACRLTDEIEVIGDLEAAWAAQIIRLGDRVAV
jgi:hypothetical protein